MTVGMNEIAGTNRHSGDANLAAKTVGVNVGVRGSDGAGERLEARRPLRGIADRSIGDNAETAQRLVHRALHLAPKGSEPNLGAIDISPLVLLLGCFFIQGLIGQVLIPLLVGA